jgi:hypothetical protein
MHKNKSIWGIAIRSSIVPFLGVIAFPLLLVLLWLRYVPNLRCLLLSWLPGGILAVGIYFTQRSYKETCQQMTYGQGVKLGFWTTFFMALWISPLVSGVITWPGKGFIPGFLEEEGITPWFVLAVFIAHLIVGTLISIVLSLFLRTKNNQKMKVYIERPHYQENTKITVCTKVEVYGVLLFAAALLPS